MVTFAKITLTILWGSFFTIVAQQPTNTLSPKSIKEIIESDKIDKKSIETDTISLPKKTSQPLDTLSKKTTVFPEKKYFFFKLNKTIIEDSTIINQKLDTLVLLQQLDHLDSLRYSSNILFLPLIFTERKITPIENKTLTLEKEWKGKYFLSDTLLYELKNNQRLKNELFVDSLRKATIRYFANNSMHLFEKTTDDLPKLSSFMSKIIEQTSLKDLIIKREKLQLNQTKIGTIGTVHLRFWTKKADAMLQFSQNYISPNWHKGGNSNLSLLSGIKFELNYDNFKKTRWENKIEWRSGFSSVEGDTLRKILANNDLLRYNTKIGFKAKGNWYYSMSGVVSTQLYKNYKGINSSQLKASLLTPVRVNIGLGMDYQYKKLFSIMLAPLSFKYVYANDTTNVNPNLFGIKKGENHLKQLGSSFRAELKYSPINTWNIYSKFSFYTDYDKIEVDWEIINNFIINEYMTTRIMLHPRYDNTVILKNNDKAKIQFQELLSVGFSFRLI